MILAGGCLCGAVRYTVTADRLPNCYACHCTDCQTQSGSAFAMQMPLAAGQLQVEGAVVSGERVQPSGATGTIYACVKCLTRLYSENSTRAGMVVLRAGTLDDSGALVPAAHFWTRSKQAWLTLPAGDNILDTQPRTLEEWMRYLTPGEAKA